MLRRVSDITKEMLDANGIEAIILDVDNTLTTHNNPVPDKDVLLWLEVMKAEKVRMVLVSNNNEKRVLPFARELGLPYTAMAMKPLTRGFNRTAKMLRLPPASIAVVGDQIFTDVLGGNLFGAFTILVEPMQAEDSLFFRLKRKFEQLVIGKE
jgi:HAD superfamily phosphatase (TIGR01668 family)